MSQKEVTSTASFYQILKSFLFPFLLLKPGLKVLSLIFHLPESSFVGLKLTFWGKATHPHRNLYGGYLKLGIFPFGEVVPVKHARINFNYSSGAEHSSGMNHISFLQNVFPKVKNFLKFVLKWSKSLEGQYMVNKIKIFITEPWGGTASAAIPQIHCFKVHHF